MIAANVNITANIIQISRYVNFVVVGKLFDELANNVDKISRQLWNEYKCQMKLFMKSILMH